MRVATLEEASIIISNITCTKSISKGNNSGIDKSKHHHHWHKHHPQPHGERDRERGGEREKEIDR